MWLKTVIWVWFRCNAWYNKEHTVTVVYNRSSALVWPQSAQQSKGKHSTMEDHVLIYCRSTMVHNTIFTANNTMTRGQHTHTIAVTTQHDYNVCTLDWSRVSQQYRGSRGHHCDRLALLHNTLTTTSFNHFKYVHFVSDTAVRSVATGHYQQLHPLSHTSLVSSMENISLQD